MFSALILCYVTTFSVNSCQFVIVFLNLEISKAPREASLTIGGNREGRPEGSRLPQVTKGRQCGRLRSSVAPKKARLLQDAAAGEGIQGKF